MMMMMRRRRRRRRTTAAAATTCPHDVDEPDRCEVLLHQLDRASFAQQVSVSVDQVVRLVKNSHQLWVVFPRSGHHGDLSSRHKHLRSKAVDRDVARSSRSGYGTAVRDDPGYRDSAQPRQGCAWPQEGSAPPTPSSGTLRGLENTAPHSSRTRKSRCR